MSQRKVIGHECRFSVFCGKPEGQDADLHTIKLLTHYDDGTKEPTFHTVRNFNRPFWVTKKAFRNHNDKKEWEMLDKVSEFKSTQSNLPRAIANALGESWKTGDVRQLAKSPYLYGADILSTAVIKQTYADKYPGLSTPYTMAPFDTETDVIMGHGQVIMATISFKERVFTAVQKSFVAGLSDVERRTHELLIKYLGEYVEKRKIKWELRFVETEGDVIVDTFKKAHEWGPDFLAIWNMNFDIPKAIEALENAGINPADVFSNPAVPEAYRFYKYKQGPKQKVTASGKVTPIKPADQWHTLFAPAGFYVIDSMCVYRKLRVANGEEPSYALDAILNKELGIRKLKFKEADGYSGIEWHQFMQKNYKLEYIIYNVFDCVSMEELDEKTLDLSIAMPMQSGCSDFSNFKSQPRRTADALHYFTLANGKVFGTTCDDMTTELDQETLGLEGWIVTLPAHLVADNGLRCIEEDPNLRTNIRAHVGDLDVSASYPNGECVFNVSKETTKRELCKVEGVSEFTQRMQGINLSAGPSNAVEFCTTMFKLPTFGQLLEEFTERR